MKGMSTYICILLKSITIAIKSLKTKMIILKSRYTGALYSILVDTSNWFYKANSSYIFYNLAIQKLYNVFQWMRIYWFYDNVGAAHLHIQELYNVLQHGYV